MCEFIGYLAIGGSVATFIAVIMDFRQAMIIPREEFKPTAQVWAENDLKNRSA
jgi:hypothetical protein